MISQATENGEINSTKAVGRGLVVDTKAAPMDAEDLLTISTASTDLTSTTSASSLVAMTPKTPSIANKESNEYETPPNQKITSWEDLALSPGSLIGFDQAQKAMQADGVTGMPFYKDGKLKVQRCVQFLYGKKFMSQKTREERIQKIQQMVAPGNLNRLADFALSNPRDTVSFNKASTEGFINMAVTQRHFFQQEEAFGSFPGKPFLRVQKGNNCHAPTCISWFSLLMRYHKEVTNAEDGYIADISQRMWHNMMTDDDALMNRVIENEGYSADTFAQQLVERPKSCEDRGAQPVNRFAWHYIDFAREQQRTYCEYFTISYGPGLVFGFKIPDQFRHAAKNLREGFGYWKFDGGDVDVEGEWVPVDSTEALIEYKKELEKELEDQQEKARLEGKQIGDRLKSKFVPMDTASDEPAAPVATESTSVHDVAPNDDETDPAPGSDGPAHYMVLLGGITRKDEQDGKQTEKKYFLLLNSWARMPLVLVSQEYLVACQAKAMFRKYPPYTKYEFASNCSLVADCASPYADVMETSDQPPDVSLYGFDNDPIEERADY